MELLGRFNDQITRIVDDTFGTQWAEIEEILAIIALVKDHAVSTRQVADVSGMNRRALSRMLSRLRENGLVVTRPSDGDGRVVEVVLTNRGEEQSEMFRTSISDLFHLSKDLAQEISAGTTPPQSSRIDELSTDPIDLLRRVCEAGASLVGFMPDAAMQGQLAARQRAALVQIATQVGVRPNDLSSSLGVSPAGAAYIVDQLCAKGYVRRLIDAVPADRRAVVLEATPEGVNAVGAVLDGIQQLRETFSALFAEVAAWAQPMADVVSPPIAGGDGVPNPH
ncbi:DNA-binding transcriptional regulator, MarR family [Agreia sp. VKM Ac-1783]|nr:DNA-binding transcriptional regulator, MarR family [Agreia sp. VKM Ac-1783]